MFRESMLVCVQDEVIHCDLVFGGALVYVLFVKNKM